MNTIIIVLLEIILVCIVIFAAIKRDNVWIPKAVKEKILRSCAFYRELSAQCRGILDAEMKENYELKAKVAKLELEKFTTHNTYKSC